VLKKACFFEMTQLAMYIFSLCRSHTGKDNKELAQSTKLMMSLVALFRL
jgi:hypothetical protein